MHFVLVHGWGFDTSIWTPLVARLPKADATRVDLGFLSDTAKDHSDWPDDAIAIGHSLGVLWLLKEKEGRFRGLISVHGFDRYCPRVPEARVVALRRSLDRDPGGTLRAFWRSCGAPDLADPAALNVLRLREGLDWLMHWDAEAAKKRLRCPILTLAARDDVIVPPAMSEAVWGAEKIVWSPDGGHVLPLKHPEWCARHVLEFANSVSS